MPASRIAFALADLVSELKGLGRDGSKHGYSVQIVCDLETFAAVKRELEYHHGGRLQHDSRHRGMGSAIIYAGMKIVGMPPGNRP